MFPIKIINHMTIHDICISLDLGKLVQKIIFYLNYNDMLKIFLYFYGKNAIFVQTHSHLQVFHMYHIKLRFQHESTVTAMHQFSTMICFFLNKVSVANIQSAIDLHQPEYSNAIQHRDNERFDNAFVWRQG